MTIVFLCYNMNKSNVFIVKKLGENMKKFLSIIMISMFLLSLGLGVLADESKDALNFFYSYVNAANTYSNNLPSYYSPNAKIIRQVVKPDGGLANAYTNTDTYVKQMKIGQATAKMRKYTNSYSNVNIHSLGDGKYKISSLRQPKGETYKLKAYMIVKKINGRWQIIEELMQTKEQIFLRYAK